jgi:hypothetical protein
MLRQFVTSGLAALLLAGASITSGAESKSSPHAFGPHAAKSAPSRDGWPDTRAAARASGWVEAFSTSEDAMRAYLEENMAEQTLAERGVAKRIESYRKLHDRLGALVLGSVDQSEPYKITVSLLGEDATIHRFAFAVQDQAPYKLVSVSMFERMHGHGFGGHGH